MGFVIGIGVVVGLLLIWAALIDISTRRQGRKPASASAIRDQVRSAKRDVWRRRLRNTKFADLVPDDPKHPTSGVYVDQHSDREPKSGPPYGSSSGRPFGTPPEPRRRGRR